MKALMLSLFLFLGLFATQSLAQPGCPPFGANFTLVNCSSIIPCASCTFQYTDATPIHIQINGGAWIPVSPGGC